MTQAVCFNCGAIKFGAFVTCPECAERPRENRELVLSLAMTDQYFDMSTLQRMAADIAAGESLHLQADQEQQMLEQIERLGVRQLLAE